MRPCGAGASAERWRVQGAVARRSGYSALARPRSACLRRISTADCERLTRAVLLGKPAQSPSKRPHMATALSRALQRHLAGSSAAQVAACDARDLLCVRSVGSSAVLRDQYDDAEADGVQPPKAEKASTQPGLLERVTARRSVTLSAERLKSATLTLPTHEPMSASHATPGTTSYANGFQAIARLAADREVHL